jgi:A/G-specific adenine glycosylase
MRDCEGRRRGTAAQLPRKAPKPLRPLRHGAHFWLIDTERNVLLRRRSPKGLLGGMTELPGTPWRAERWDEREALAHAPMQADWRRAGEVRHGFTHFELHLALYAAVVPRIEGDGFLRPATTLADEALPSLMRKCVAALQPFDRAAATLRNRTRKHSVTA